jgi:hypothetical protein
MTFKSRCVGSVTLLCLLACAGAVSLRAAQDDAKSPKIEGAWLLHIAAVSCQTGAQLGSFSSLYAFAAGGALTNTTNGAAPASRTPGLGTWERTGSHTFKAVSMTFLFSSGGVWTGTQKIANSFEISHDGDELTGTITVEIFNTSGTLLSTMCATPVGQRLDP